MSDRSTSADSRRRRPQPSPHRRGGSKVRPRQGAGPPLTSKAGAPSVSRPFPPSSHPPPVPPPPPAAGCPPASGPALAWPRRRWRRLASLGCAAALAFRGLASASRARCADTCTRARTHARMHARTTHALCLPACLFVNLSSVSVPVLLSIYLSLSFRSHRLARTQDIEVRRAAAKQSKEKNPTIFRISYGTRGAAYGGVEMGRKLSC